MRLPPSVLRLLRRRALNRLHKYSKSYKLSKPSNNDTMKLTALLSTLASATLAATTVTPASKASNIDPDTTNDTSSAHPNPDDCRPWYHAFQHLPSADSPLMYDEHPLAGSRASHARQDHNSTANTNKPWYNSFAGKQSIDAARTGSKSAADPRVLSSDIPRPSSPNFKPWYETHPLLVGELPNDSTTKEPNFWDWVPWYLDHDDERSTNHDISDKETDIVASMDPIHILSDSIAVGASAILSSYKGGQSSMKHSKKSDTRHLELRKKVGHDTVDDILSDARSAAIEALRESNDESTMIDDTWTDYIDLSQLESLDHIHIIADSIAAAAVAAVISDARKIANEHHITPSVIMDETSLDEMDADTELDVGSLDPIHIISDSVAAAAVSLVSDMRKGRFVDISQLDTETKALLESPNDEELESALQKFHFFPPKTITPNVDVTYDFPANFDSVINAYKMAEVPSPLMDSSPEFAEVNQFHSRKLIKHDFFHNKENMRFRVVLKPFAWADKIPLFNFLFNLQLVAFEDWIVDWRNKRAECLISNGTMRWSFGVDEFVVIQHKNLDNATDVEIYKALYVSAFIPIPSLMFWNYKDYSDVYINVIRSLAASRCGGIGAPPELLSNDDET